MFKKVKKINKVNDEGQSSLGSYELTMFNDEIFYVPLKTGNTHYQQILEWEKIDGNNIEDAD